MEWLFQSQLHPPTQVRYEVLVAPSPRVKLSVNGSFEGWTSGSICCYVTLNFPETINASDCSRHVNTITGVLSGKMYCF